MDLIFNIIPYILTWPTIIAFAFFTLLFCSILIYSKLNWVFKAIITLFSFIVYILVFISITSSFGWPLRSNMVPIRFQIIGVYAQLPEEHLGFKGGIDYWLRIYDENMHLVVRSPRVIELPYSKERYKQAMEIQKKLKDGESVFGSGTKSGKGQGGDGALDLDGQNGHGKAGGTLLDRLKRFFGFGGGLRDNFKDDSADGLRLIKPPDPKLNKDLPDGPDQENSPPELTPTPNTGGKQT